MRVTVRSTPRRLVLRLVPVKLAGYWLFGVLFLIAAVVTMAAMGHATMLACQAGAEGRSCRLSRSSFLVGSRVDLPAPSLRAARVDTTRGFVAGMRLVLETDSGDIPLRLVNATGAAKESLAVVINNFVVADPRYPSFTIREDARPVALLLGVMLLAAGATCLLAIERTVCELDRGAGTVRIRRRRWFAGRTVTMPLDALEGVATRPLTFKHTRSWSVVLEFGGGHGPVPLTAMPMFTDASAEQVKRIIDGWLTAP